MKPRTLHEGTHAFVDVHEFREWMSAPREDEEQDAASDDLLSGRVTIAKTPVKHLGTHAGVRRGCDAGHAYGALSRPDVRYGYCGNCDRILECERVPPPRNPERAYEDDVWFPIEWDRRSRDGWICVRNERALRARSRLIDRCPDFENEADDEELCLFGERT